MPQSLSKVIIHIIFSTKNRDPWLDREVRPRMHAYVATICRDLNADPLRVGGVADHLHIVTTLPRTLSQSEMVETVKKTSSKWIKRLDPNIGGSTGSAARARSPLAPVSSRPFSNTWRIRPSTIAPAVFKRSIAAFCRSTASNSTNAMCGIDVILPFDSRFQRWLFG